MTTNAPICATRLARKMEAIHNFESEKVQAQIDQEPRLEEVLWLLQYLSWPENYAGGLRKFTRDLVEASPDLIGTATMQAHEGEFDDEALYEISQEMPSGIPWEEGIDCFSVVAASFGDTPEFEYVNRAPRAALEQRCREKALEGLEYYLRQLCEVPEIGFHRAAGRCYDGSSAPWYFANVAAALLRWMDDWKSHRRAMIAETEVSRLVCGWLAKVRKVRRSIAIEGNSRFGKTESARTWCEMNAGAARFIKTPDGSTETELLRTVARALGIDLSRHKGHSALREAIGDVLRHSRLFLVIDEAQFLFPGKFTKTTAPARLNFVRCSVMDEGTPCVFVFTPQSMKAARGGYLKATGFAIEQFDGRLLGKPIVLPDEVSVEDLHAIAAIHLPGVEDELLIDVAKTAAVTGRNYVSDVSAIGVLAFSNAEDAGRTLPNDSDIQAAIAAVLPTAAPRTTSEPAAAPMQGRCNDDSDPFAAAARETTPAVASRINFESDNPADVLTVGV